MLTSYQFASNSSIANIDLDGLEAKNALGQWYYDNFSGGTVTQLTNDTWIWLNNEQTLHRFYNEVEGWSDLFVYKKQKEHKIILNSQFGDDVMNLTFNAIMPMLLLPASEIAPTLRLKVPSASMFVKNLAISAAFEKIASDVTGEKFDYYDATIGGFGMGAYAFTSPLLDIHSDEVKTFKDKGFNSTVEEYGINLIGYGIGRGLGFMANKFATSGNLLIETGEKTLTQAQSTTGIGTNALIRAGLFRKSAEQISSGKFDLGISKIAGATNYAADLSGKMLSKENAKR